MSVVAWTISYDIGYMSSSVNLETHTESNLFFQFLFLFENKI
jgi:hypothetical protein